MNARDGTSTELAFSSLVRRRRLSPALYCSDSGGLVPIECITGAVKENMGWLPYEDRKALFEPQII